MASVPAACCDACGAVLAAGASWCSLCHTPASVEPPEPPAMGARFGGSDALVRPRDPGWTAAARPVRPQVGRFAATEVSFGPVGRVVATGLVLLPLWFFYVTAALAWQGLIIWGGFVLPWALRDIWRRPR